MKAGPDTQRHSRIAGTGSHLPPHRVDNAELVARLHAQGIEASDAWIKERTGIEARYHASDGVAASDMGAQAARHALRAADCRPQDVDLIIVATTTPDKVFPSTACMIQHKLGMHGFPAFDVQAVCAGFVYALYLADALIRAGNVERALVIGTDTFSRLVDFSDRTTCVLFGDGAGAVVLEASHRPGIVAVDMHADGRHGDILHVPAHLHGGQLIGRAVVHMDGQAVFKQAVSMLEDSVRSVLDKAGRSTADIDWLIPHQANIRIMQTLARKLALPLERLVETVSRHGNTSAASIPLALDHAVREGHIQRGDTLLLCGVGAGFAWGSLLIEHV